MDNGYKTEFGLIEDGTTYGINVNYVTQTAHRDPIGKLLYRYVPCRVEGVSSTSAEKQEIR